MIAAAAAATPKSAKGARSGQASELALLFHLSFGEESPLIPEGFAVGTVVNTLKRVSISFQSLQNRNEFSSDQSW